MHAAMHVHAAMHTHMLPHLAGAERRALHKLLQHQEDDERAPVVD
jgi:hypothetical protein